MACIDQLVAFAASERQLYVIEGSNVVPGLLSPHGNVAVVELYLRVTDAETHRRMLGGPTHDRTLNDAEFRRCRQIQDFVEAEAAKRGSVVAEFDEGVDAVEELIEKAIEAAAPCASLTPPTEAKSAARSIARSSQNAVASTL
jgi:2-phosphoglycerate kinase